MSVIDTNGSVVKQEPPADSRLSVRALLGGSKKDELQKVAGAAMSAEALVKLFAIAASRTPKLMACTPLSVLDCMVKCAELKLMPSTLGSVYLIPYENRKANTCECQLIVGYRGLVELARRSGFISTIQAEVVRDGDEFEFEHGIHPKFRHKPCASDMSDSKITHAWAMATFKDGAHQLVVMTRAEVDRIRGMSRAGKFGPWADHYGEMAKKTALRRLCKYLPLTVDVEVAISNVDRAEVALDFGEMGTGEQVGQEPEPATAPSVAAKVEQIRAATVAAAKAEPAKTTKPAAKPINDDLDFLSDPPPFEPDSGT
jgi:recombination protein RecT